MMKHSRKKEELKGYIEEHRGEIRQLSMETRCFLGALLDQYDILENNERKTKDVCQAWDGAMLMYRDEGISEGITIGRSEGITIGRSEGITIGRSEGVVEGKQQVAKTCINVDIL